MKNFLLVIAMVISMVQAHATTLTLDGDLTWNVTEPRCTFQLKGKIQNNTAFGSGQLTLVLYATEGPFPSSGVKVGQYTLGSLPSGYQFTDFTVKTPSNLPVVSGTLYFTIAVVETIGTTSRTVLAVPTGTRVLKSGNFPGQKKWTIPTKTVLPPVGLLETGNFFKLTLKATDELNQFPDNLQERTKIFINSATKLTSTLRSDDRPATYLYTTKNGRFNGKRVTYGNLAMTFGNSKVTLSLYYQSLNSGTYKSLETTSAGTETTWGYFKMP